MAQPPDDKDNKLPYDDPWRRYRPDWDESNRPNVIHLFNRLGYNLYNSDDVNRLAENLRFAEDSRKRYEAVKSRRLGWIVSLGIALLGAFLTSVGQWVASHFSK